MDSNQQIPLSKKELDKIKWIKPIYEYFVKNNNNTIHRDELTKIFGYSSMSGIIKKLKNLNLVTGENYIKMTARYEEAIKLMDNS